MIFFVTSGSLKKLTNLMAKKLDTAEPQPVINTISQVFISTFCHSLFSFVDNYGIIFFWQWFGTPEVSIAI